MGTSVRSTPSLVVREQRGTPQITMAELGLKKKEIDAIEFAFDVYDFKGDGNVDAFYAGDLIRACNLNPTLKTIAEVGGESEKGQIGAMVGNLRNMANDMGGEISRQNNQLDRINKKAESDQAR